MRILIATGIYPPDIGGPAQYARNLYETWKNSAEVNSKRNTTRKNEVKVAAYRWERAFPSLIRHVLYFLKTIRKGWNADLILVLDTWSAAVPTMLACALMRKKYLIRTGGDFLWESYVERTSDLVLFRDFYETRIDKLSFKEKLIFKWGGATLRKATAIIFSTEWQRGIFEKAYNLNPNKNYIVENYCGERLEPVAPESRVFVAGTRQLKWKNIELLREAFEEARAELKKRGFPDIELDTSKAMYVNFIERMRRAYAVILVSLGDISPNMIFDAVRTGTPFILTKENGIARRVRDAVVFVDPQNKKDIVEKIVWLADPVNRKTQAEKVRQLSFKHSWQEIADEIVKIWKKTQ
jgi:glycosyltransferase involved in cell wall biosynthesis